VTEPGRLGLELERASLSLEGRVAIVTGASRGLGEAIAVGYAAAGADIVLAARSVEDLERVAEQVRARGRRALVVPTDVTVPEECERLAARAVEGFGRVEILVNNAGLPRGAAPTLEVSPAKWDELLLANLHSAFYCCRYVGAHMVERGYGKIINMSSQMGLVGYRDRAAYCAAKGGMNNLTRALAVEWAPHQVCVNALAPTHIETPANSERVHDPAFVAEMLPRIPMGHFGRWEDVVGAAVFFAAPASDLVTGQVLAIDGGWTAQ
jgi:NAD(P)-dependent dehydrogenase (short-subunit alcohol dehydrogenase family)